MTQELKKKILDVLTECFALQDSEAFITSRIDLNSIKKLPVKDKIYLQGYYDALIDANMHLLEYREFLTQKGLFYKSTKKPFRVLSLY